MVVPSLGGIGKRAEVSGAVPRGTRLLVRIRAGRRLATAVFDHVGPMHGRATLSVHRTRTGAPAAVLVGPGSRIRPTRTVVQPWNARQGW